MDELVRKLHAFLASDENWEQDSECKECANDCESRFCAQSSQNGALDKAKKA